MNTALLNEGNDKGDLTANSVREIAKYCEANLGKENEATKLFNNAYHELEKIKKNPGKAVMDIPKNVVNEIDRGAKKIANAFGIHW